MTIVNDKVTILVLNEANFECPKDWTVAEAEKSIRSRYELNGGCLECPAHSLFAKPDEIIGDISGELFFNHADLINPGV